MCGNYVHFEHIHLNLFHTFYHVSVRLKLECRFGAFVDVLVCLGKGRETQSISLGHDHFVDVLSQNALFRLCVNPLIYHQHWTNRLTRREGNLENLRHSYPI